MDVQSQTQSLPSLLMQNTSTHISKPLLTLTPEPAERCCICNETLGLPRPDGQTEQVFVLPCSHTFGSICITRWLEHDSANRDCPHCRRRMVYSGCGHAIKPFEISRAPKCIGERDMPEQCLVCRGGGVLAEQVRVIRERQVAIQRALEGMRAVFPGVMGGMCRGTVESVDMRIEESRDEWGEEVAAIYAELERDRSQW